MFARIIQCFRGRENNERRTLFIYSSARTEVFAIIMCARVAFDKPIRSARNTSRLARSHNAFVSLDRARTSGCRRLDVRQTETIRFVCRPRGNGRRRNRLCYDVVTTCPVTTSSEIVCRPLQCNPVQYPPRGVDGTFCEISLLWRVPDRDYLRYYSATVRRERIFG